MTEKEKLLQKVDKKVDKDQTESTGTKNLLRSLGAGLVMLLAKEGMGQEVKVQDPQISSKEVAYQSSIDALDSTVTWDDAVDLAGVESDSVGGDQVEDVVDESQDSGAEETSDQPKEKKTIFEVHGSVRGGSDVTPLLGSLLSDRPALILTLDVSNPQTGLGASVIRADDFSSSMENPASQVTLLDLYWQKKFGKVGVTAVGEYASIDKLPGAESITPLVGVTYDAGKGWIFDAWVGHTFQKGEDADMARLGVTKKLDEAFSLAAQVFYNSGLDKKFYGRVQANVSFGKGFGAQLSFIYKDGKLTPTMGVVYGF